ncbi:hypothetical protein CHS0354_030523 [Potamilus streckersoni]|uniref:Uncharacterized protein n=1 Tax=Potamilus streckersoni TaxID=2493646 RepID=A0AAE0RPH6_9BIVA|nr:hypothetical protein CHS0354_030523 [Potamilus streckersoni]
MSPNKNKRVTSKEDSPDPEEKRSKRKKYSDDEEDYGKDEDSKAPSTSKKTPLSAHSTHNKPAELFRKDLISAMKLADSEQLNEEDYILIADQWRQDWERGVQVPVNKEGILLVEMRPVIDKYSLPGDFKIPKKYLHDTRDETYKQGIHELTGMQQLAEQVVRYDLDDLDVCWLQKVNEEREEMGEVLIHEWTMERLIETFENDCHETMEMKKKTEEGLGIEYDEDVVCEVCRSPDSEENNEMVFCDGCDICVHQACYGIQKVPEGSWLCRICALGIKPTCILCPKTGGAMKSTRSGTKWAHVSCAIWIPEVSIACVEKMEPVTKISQVPASRWALICTICKERTGACIQCSVKSCKTAFHVSCAIQDNLEMKTILVEDEEDPDDAVKLKAYCPKHCKKRDQNSSESETDSPRKSNSGTPRKDMTEEEIDHLRKEKLKQLKEEFYKCVDRAKVADKLILDPEIVDLVFIYWKLKRKTNFDQPLLTPRTQEAEILEKQQEDSLVARMKMFVRLRQDLERVRNLCYMVSRREKIKRSYNRVRENIFYAALNVLMDKKYNLSAREIEKIIRKFSPPMHKETLFPAASKKSPSTVQTETENIISSGASSGVLTQGTSQSGLLSGIKHKRKERQKLNFDSASIKKEVVTNDAAVDVKEELSSAEIGTMTEDNIDVSEGTDQTNVTSEGNSQISHFKDFTIDSEKKSTSSNLEGPVKPTRGRPPKSRLKLRHKLNSPIQEDLNEIPLNVNNNSVIATGVISTSEGETRTPIDDNIDEENESTRMSLRTRAKRESDLSPVESENANKEARNNYSIVIKKELKETLVDENYQTPDLRGTYLTSKNKDKNQRDFLSTRRKGNSLRKDRQALLQGQESLKKYFTPVERNSNDEVEIKIEKNIKEEDKTMVHVQEVRSSVVSEDSALDIIKSETNEEFKNTVLQRQTRRSVPLRNSKSIVSPRGRVQEKHLVRDKCIDSLPSSKNVSEHIKNELNGYLRNNKLIVSNKLKDKVQIHLLRKQKQNHIHNGFHDKSQTKLDSLFSKPRTLADSWSSHLSSPDFRNSFRVLNELSPMRDGDGNVNRTENSPGLRRQSPLLDKKNIHESITTRSVSRKIDRDFDSHIIDGVMEKKHFTTNHETSPTSTNSLHSSSREFSGSKVEAEKLLLRSLSPTQSAKSYDESDLIDVENLYEEEFPRRTRSQGLDEERSQSPRNSLR